jgi:hypothetical protein
MLLLPGNIVPVALTEGGATVSNHGSATVTYAYHDGDFASGSTAGQILAGATSTLYGTIYFTASARTTLDIIPLAADAGEVSLADLTIPSSKLIRDLPTAAMMSPLPTFGSKITGLSTATEAANTTIVGVLAHRRRTTRPPLRHDVPHHRPYQYLFGSTSQDMGAAQNTPPSGTPGPTAMLGFYEFELLTPASSRSGCVTLRSRSTCGCGCRRTVGPFMATDTSLAPHTITAVGDGLYILQPIDIGSTEDSWRIIIAGQTFTFGGVRIESDRNDQLPEVPGRAHARRPRLVFSVTASQTYLFPSYPMPMAFELGLLPHVDGVGGTGFLAVSGNGTLFRNYRDRWAYNVSPFFTDTDPAVGADPGIDQRSGVQPRRRRVFD